MNRRQFLRNTAIATAAVVAASVPLLTQAKQKRIVEYGTFNNTRVLINRQNKSWPDGLRDLIEELNEAMLHASYGECTEKITQCHVSQALERVCHQHVCNRGVSKSQVICDASNNPPNVMDARAIRAEVYVTLSNSCGNKWLLDMRVDSRGVRTRLHALPYDHGRQVLG